jgi:hypothetical protein
LAVDAFNHVRVPLSSRCFRRALYASWLRHFVHYRLLQMKRLTAKRGCMAAGAGGYFTCLVKVQYFPALITDQRACAGDFTGFVDECLPDLFLHQQ